MISKNKVPIHERREITLSETYRSILHFGYHQAMSCIFPIAIFGNLALSNVVQVPFIPRYDGILLVLLAVQ